MRKPGHILQRQRKVKIKSERKTENKFTVYKLNFNAILCYVLAISVYKSHDTSVNICVAVLV